MNTPIFKQDERGIAVEKIMDENVPGWRDKWKECKTFDAYVKWVGSCVRGILLNKADRKDH